MSLLSLNLMLGISVIFFVIIGFSSAEKTPLAECGTGCARNTTADGKEYGYKVHDELVVYSLDVNKRWMFHCLGYDRDCNFPDEDPSGGFRNDKRTALHDVDFGYKMDNVNVKDWIRKYEVAVMEPKYINDFIFPYDVTAFGFPAFSYYMNNQQNLKVLISAGNLNTYDLNGNGPYVYFSDPEDKCRNHRPTSKLANVTNFMNMNLYINVKYGKNAYYFIKKDKYICGYELEHSHLYQTVKSWQKAPEIKIVNYYIIDYPTINYAPNFFCIDALYGAFVSLYWDQQPSHPPEAHFYEINEINLNNIQMVHKVILTNFDDNVLRMIFANDFDAEFQPVFQSYGGQVFVWFKLPEYQPTIQRWKYENKAWHGLWKNGNDYDVQYQDIKAFSTATLNNEWVNPNIILFRAKKSWITKDRPIKAGVPRPPRTTTKPPKTTTKPPKTTTKPPKTTTTPAAPNHPAPAPTTPVAPPSTEPPPPPKTTTLPPRMPSTTLPPTNPSRSSPQQPTSVPQPQKPMNATSTSAPLNAPSSSTIPGSSNSSSESASNGTNANQTMPSPQHLNDKSNVNDDGNCSFSKNLPWIFILLIILDVVEVIILAVLVFLKFRGAKKMREAMAKKKALKSVKNDKKKKPSTESKQSMPMKKKKQKKSTKETSVTKTEVGKTTVSEAPKTTICQTNYYTINESVKKEAK